MKGWEKGLHVGGGDGSVRPMFSASTAWEGLLVPPGPATRLQCQPAPVPSSSGETSRTSFKISTQFFFADRKVAGIVKELARIYPDPPVTDIYFIILSL